MVLARSVGGNLELMMISAQRQETMKEKIETKNLPKELSKIKRKVLKDKMMLW